MGGMVPTNAAHISWIFHLSTYPSCYGPGYGSYYADNSVYHQDCCMKTGDYTLACNDWLSNGWDGATLQINGETICSLTPEDGAQTQQTYTVTAQSDNYNAVLLPQEISDFGYPFCGSGWFDAQNQGVANDYCRW